MSVENECEYLELLNEIYVGGVDKSDRTGVGTRSLFAEKMTFDLSQGIPILTTKRIHFKSVVVELLWFLRGDQDITYLKQNGVTIWDDWSDENGYVGPMYGFQWRNWNSNSAEPIDQINELIKEIKKNPNSRRQIVTAWNPTDIRHQALPCCHILFQTNVTDGHLNMQVYQRSADMFLGVPFNIASYSMLLVMLAQQTNLIPGHLTWVGGDVHIYSNHFEQVREQLSREPFEPPKITIHKADSIFEYQLSDFVIEDYKHHPAIKGPVAV